VKAVNTIRQLVKGNIRQYGNTIRQLVKGNIRQYGMIIALIFLVIYFQISTNGVLLTSVNITNLINQQGYILIMAIGMMLVIITGYVDLSIGSVVAATAAIAAVLMIDNGIPVMIGIPIVLMVGALIGCWHGFFISAINIPPFIVTLSGMLIFRGVCQSILAGETKAGFPEAFLYISKGFVSYEVMGMEIISLLLGAGIIILVIFMEFKGRRSKQKYNLEVLPIYLSIAKITVISIVVAFFAYSLSNDKGVPAILFIVLGLAAFYSFLMKSTVLGRHIYAVGGNQDAARLSGISVAKIKFFVFVNMGVLAALAGMVIAARLTSASPRIGVGYELDAIAACYVGGASTSGGIGTIVGGIIGALVMGILNMGMSLMGMPIDSQNIIKGLVLIAAVCFDIYAKKKSAAA